MSAGRRDRTSKTKERATCTKSMRRSQSTSRAMTEHGDLRGAHVGGSRGAQREHDREGHCRSTSGRTFLRPKDTFWPRATRSELCEKSSSASEGAPTDFSVDMTHLHRVSLERAQRAQSDLLRNGGGQEGSPRTETKVCSGEGSTKQTRTTLLWLGPCERIDNSAPHISKTNHDYFETSLATQGSQKA